MSKMITTSFGLLFYLKKNKKSVDNEQPIYYFAVSNATLSKFLNLTKTIVSFKNHSLCLG